VLGRGVAEELNVREHKQAAVAVVVLQAQVQQDTISIINNNK